MKDDLTKDDFTMQKIFNLITSCLLVGSTVSCMCGSNGNQAVAKESKADKAEISETATETVSPIGSGQEKIGDKVEFDKTIHNFGDIMLSDGPQSCTFTMKNISGKPVVIYSVVTSCGCTDVKWSREPIMPGKTGTISATYTNDEGPYPFDKTLTAYISDVSKPVILHLRGISHKTKMSLENLYPQHIGVLGMKSLELKCGNVEQGSSRSDETNIANLSDKPVKVTFADVSKGLTVKVSPNPIPARSIAKVQFTVTADRSIWGKNMYCATILDNGKSTEKKLSVYAFTKENFSNLTDSERAEGSRPIFESSTYSAGKIRAGKRVEATWTFSNVGKSDFKVYKIDIDNDKATYAEPSAVSSGYKGTIKVSLDTSGMPAGEMLVMATMTTNSPTRPIINLFITGWIE